MPSALASCSAVSPRSLPAPSPRRTAPTALVGWKPRWRRSGAQARAEAIVGLVAGDDRLDQRRAADAPRRSRRASTAGTTTQPRCTEPWR